MRRPFDWLAAAHLLLQSAIVCGAADVRAEPNALERFVTMRPQDIRATRPSAEF